LQRGLGHTKYINLIMIARPVRVARAIVSNKREIMIDNYLAACAKQPTSYKDIYDAFYRKTSELAQLLDKNCSLLIFKRNQ